MASRSQKSRDTRREATQAAPTSRPPKPSTSSSTPTPSKSRKRYVQPERVPKLVDMSDEHMWWHARSRGISKSAFPTWKEEFKKELVQMDIERGPVRVIGLKPVRNGPDVFKLEIPETSLLIRLWDGGVEDMGQYTLDIFDREADEPINTYDAGISIVPVYKPGEVPYAGLDGKLTSMERAFGFAHEEIDYGGEKFIVDEGSRWLLQRDGAKDFLFVVPSRPPPSEFHIFSRFEEA